MIHARARSTARATNPSIFGMAVPSEGVVAFLSSGSAGELQTN